MRSLYTVAALAAATKAQSTTYRPSATSYNPYSSSSQYSAPSQYSASYPSNYGYSKPAVTYVAPVPKKPDHEHDNTMQHENPWDACQRDIAEADMDLMLIGEKCEPIGFASLATGGLATSLMGLRSQMCSSDELAAQATALGQIISKNEDQGIVQGVNGNPVGIIFDIQEELRDCKDIVQESQLSLAMLQLMVDNLPSLADLESRLFELERIQGNVAQDSLGLQQETLDTAIDVNTTALGATTGDLTGLQTASAQWLTTINGLKSDAAVNETARNTFADTTLVDLADTWGKMQITSDYFNSNASIIPLGPGSNALPGTVFCVEQDEIMEFYLSGTIASDAAGAGVSIEAFKISLQNSAMTEVVAQAYTLDLADEFGRNFALYYKSDVQAADETYSVFVDTDGAAQFAVNELQWGYRTYGIGHISGTNVPCNVV